jgi:hypothetical protein
MLSVRQRTKRRGKETENMHPYATFVVTHKMEALRQDAATQRLLAKKPTFASRMASALRAARVAITTPAPAASALTPTLSDYPYRS